MRAGQNATVSGVEASRAAGESLQTIAGQVEQISDINHQVATATEEQSSVTEEVTRNAQGIADLAHATASEVRDCQANCQALAELAADLSRQMERFQL